MARAMLGQWEEAAKYLRLASKLDHDEEIDYVLKMVLLYFFLLYGLQFYAIADVALNSVG